jgi:hypothetical protein
MRLLSRRWWLWSAVALLLAGLMGAALVLLFPHSRITKANFKQIRHGMTAAEVRAILGRPPEVVLRGPQKPQTSFGSSMYEYEDLGPPDGRKFNDADEEERLYWADATSLSLQPQSIQLGHGNAIVLALDANGRVLCGSFSARSSRPSLWDRIRRQLRAWGW